jgi:hypothetical protein
VRSPSQLLGRRYIQHGMFRGKLPSVAGPPVDWSDSPGLKSATRPTRTATRHRKSRYLQCIRRSGGLGRQPGEPTRKTVGLWSELKNGRLGLGVRVPDTVTPGFQVASASGTRNDSEIVNDDTTSDGPPERDCRWAPRRRH